MWHISLFPMILLHILEYTLLMPLYIRPYEQIFFGNFPKQVIVSDIE